MKGVQSFKADSKEWDKAGVSEWWSVAMGGNRVMGCLNGCINNNTFIKTSLHITLHQVRVDDFKFFDSLCTFYFLLIDFYCTVFHFGYSINILC